MPGPRSTLQAALLLLVVLGSGCGGPATLRLPEPDLSPAEAVDLPVPVWRVGERWTMAAQDGAASTYVVEAVEPWANTTAYRVRAEGSSPGLFWYEASSLGLVGFRHGDQDVTLTCASGALFPAEGRSRTCHASDGGVSLDEVALGGWHDLKTPAGQTWRVLEYRFSDEEWGQRGMWYAPEAGHVVAYHGYGRNGPVLHHLESLQAG